MDKLQYDGPVVLAILDGVGLAPDAPGNAVSKANTPFLGQASQKYKHLALEASGEAVGLMKGQMGNSEVGHNIIGSGQIIKQGVARINEAFSTGEVFDNDIWREAVKHQTLHFAGIFSDGGVHSHNDHLKQMIERAYVDGVRKMRIHAILDGRDVEPQSAEKYIQDFEEFVKQFGDADIKIASVGGRMTTVADRYEKDWQMVKRGFDMMVYGKAERQFRSAMEGVLTLRNEHPEIQDQDLPAFVVVDENGPVGKIARGDTLIYYNFRKDRAIEIAKVFVLKDFPYFDRGDYAPENVYFVGMTEYDVDAHVPEHYLVELVAPKNTLHEFLGERGISQLAISETVKFGHITYYFDGNSYEAAPLEDFIEIESYDQPFNDHPEMRTAEITEAVLKKMNQYKFVRINYPGGDMVGHTADMEATIKALEAIDVSLAQIYAKVKELNGALVVVADHGNAEEIRGADDEPKTAHTTNLVPCIFCDDTLNNDKYRLSDIEKLGLANLAATIAVMLGQNDYPVTWEKPLLTVV